LECRRAHGSSRALTMRLSSAPIVSDFSCSNHDCSCGTAIRAARRYLFELAPKSFSIQSNFFGFCELGA
jgi:hypothetical protein